MIEFRDEGLLYSGDQESVLEERPTHVTEVGCPEFTTHEGRPQLDLGQVVVAKSVPVY